MARTANKHNISILLATETDFTVVLVFSHRFANRIIGVWIIHNT